MWIADARPAARTETLSEVGADVTIALRRSGYLRQRWFPIGADFQHGFAVATRLEHTDVEGKVDELNRWVAWHPEAANLFWLSQATTTRVPSTGRYRVFLLAFTDLPIGPTPVAPVWTRDTLMEGPEVSETLTAADLPGGRSLGSARFAAYVYVYERSARDDEGRLMPAEASRPVGEPANPPGWLTDGLAVARWRDALALPLHRVAAPATAAGD